MFASKRPSEEIRMGLMVTEWLQLRDPIWSFTIYGEHYGIASRTRDARELPAVRLKWQAMSSPFPPLDNS
jgi:hypothetical protein